MPRLESTPALEPDRTRYDFAASAWAVVPLIPACGRGRAPCAGQQPHISSSRSPRKKSDGAEVVCGPSEVPEPLHVGKVGGLLRSGFLKCVAAGCRRTPPRKHPGGGGFPRKREKQTLHRKKKEGAGPRQ